MKGISLVAVIFASCCSIYFAREWGTFQTQDQREYWVVEENGRQFAVVDTYKEYMIMMPFQGTTYQREYRLVKPENIKDPIKLVVLNDSLRDSGR
jgi:membrane-anchored protein YejM (alkaline phosphatase superfamily)